MNESISKLSNIEIGKRRASDETLALLCTKFSSILLSGTNLDRTIKIIAGQTSDKKLKKILDECYYDVKSGKTFSYSLEKRGEKYFPQSFIETIRAGEASGSVEASFNNLKNFHKKRTGIAKQIKNALIYPAFVLVVAIVVLIVIMLYVMPKLTSIFESMDSEIPAITKILVGITDFTVNNFVLIALITAFLIFAIICFSKTQKGKRYFDHMKLKTPVFGKIIIYNNSALFSQSLSMLLGSGLIMTKALSVTSNMFGNVVFKESLSEVYRQVTQGKGLAYSMRKEKAFPDTLVDMVGVGEKSGEMESVLSSIGEYYQEESDNLIKKTLNMLEPVILVLVTAFAAFIVFAIYIPLFQMYDLF